MGYTEALLTEAEAYSDAYWPRAHRNDINPPRLPGENPGLARCLDNLVAALRESAQPERAEWEYRSVARFKDQSIYEVAEWSADREAAEKFVAARNAEEPRPNVVDGDDIELTWTVEGRYRPRPSDWSDWSPSTAALTPEAGS